MKRLYFQVFLAVVVLAALCFTNGCLPRAQRKAVTALYDSIRNVTYLQSQEELIEIYPVLVGYGPELWVQAAVECSGNDTSCLPLAITLRWIHRSSHTRSQFGIRLFSPDWVRYRAGDQITVHSTGWNMTMTADSLLVAESTSQYYDHVSKETRLNHIVTQTLSCTITPDRLQQLTEIQSFTVELSDKQTFRKSRKVDLKLLREFTRIIRQKMGR